ncbi:MAG: SRPBCC domain-containing protein [Williamsia sp.]|nr:SRPBCC domain-containing protein [Williamsia sp.]
MNKKDYVFCFASTKTPQEIYGLLLQIDKWWSGFYDEQISGSSQQLQDEFSFTAGNGLHYSKQKLVELVPGKKIAWLVTDSQLSFVADKAEWNQTKLIFDIEEDRKRTHVTFTHQGLTPHLACYDSCSGAWSQYMNQLKVHLS